MPVRVPEPQPSTVAVTILPAGTPNPTGAEELDRRRELGQFFTPPVVAEFVWDMLEIIHGARFPRRSRVIDPSCGEGVFLRVATGRGAVAPGGLFGADIDAALARVWRRDPVLKEAHLLVANGLLDLADRGVGSGSFDLVVGNPPFAGKGVRDVLRLLEEAKSPAGVQESDLFGALILQERPAPAGPPLTAPERAELDQLARSLARYACWRLAKDAPENGEGDPGEGRSTADLFAGRGASPLSKNGASDLNHAAEFVSAWPPNRLLDPLRPETRLLLRRLASTAIEVFFMERFVRLTRPGGLVAVIVPESIVASDQLAPLRTWLLTQIELLAVVSLPQKVFAGVGANARTSVVFARRLLRPKSELPPADPPADEEDSEAGAGVGTEPKVFLAAPNTESKEYLLESYLADVVRGAKERAALFRPAAD